MTHSYNNSIFGTSFPENQENLMSKQLYILVKLTDNAPKRQTAHK